MAPDAHPAETNSRAPFALRRLGVVMQPEAGRAEEAEGVLNPGAARGRDGELYLFPRLVAPGNYSRIGIARVRFSSVGEPESVERLGIALEPEADYERRPNGGGGCEDPRITFVEPLDLYVMTYTAFSTRGPRIALAISPDLFSWERLGLATFRPHDGLEFDGIDNKDAAVFPETIPGPDGDPTMAIIHRPLFPGTDAPETAECACPRSVDIERESIWIAHSYCSLEMDCKMHHLCRFKRHNRLASPATSWERLKIGGGTPPVRTPHGWLMLYHGVSQMPGGGGFSYSAGVLILDQKQPHVIRYRSTDPVLIPELEEEVHGAVSNVVFPTGVDVRHDLGKPDRIDVYYGMADSRIGVAVLEVPETLPGGGVADAAGGMV